MFKKKWSRILPYAPALFLNPRFILLKILAFPKKNLKKWDEINKHHRVFGYYAGDAHTFYRPIFSLLKIHIVLDKALSSDFETARNEVFSALRSGRFFNAVDAAACATGFRFYGETNSKKINMGEVISLEHPVNLSIKAPFRFNKEVQILCDGKVVLSSEKEEMTYAVINPGVYRTQVFLKEKSPLSNDVPWICSNPIFIRKKGHEDR